MIVIIRISGLVGIRNDVARTLEIMRLRRKYACTLLPANSETHGMLEKVKNYAAYGEISQESLKELLQKRGKIPGDKLVDVKRITDELVKKVIETSSTEDLKKIGLKPFFRLHPPIGGFKKSTKLLFPKGVLGDYKDKINILLKKMI